MEEEKKYSKKSLIKSGFFNKNTAKAFLEDRDYTIKEAEEIIKSYLERVIR